MLDHDHAPLDGPDPRELDLGDRPCDQRLGDRRAGQERHAQAALDHALGGLDVVQLHDAARHHPGAPEQGIGEVVVGRGPVEQDELRAVDGPDVDAPGPRERVVGPGHEHQLVLEQGLAHDARVAHLADHRQLDLAPHDLVHELLGVGGAHQQPHVRIALGVARQELGQDVGADTGGGTDGQLARRPPRHSSATRAAPPRRDSSARWA